MAHSSEDGRADYDKASVKLRNRAETKKFANSAEVVKLLNVMLKAGLVAECSSDTAVNEWSTASDVEELKVMKKNTRWKGSLS